MRPECLIGCIQVSKGEQVASGISLHRGWPFRDMGNGIWNWIGSTARLTKVKRLKIRNAIVFSGSAINIGKAGA
jgi:hypothetical protein